jgi:hypothetical protein
LQITRRQKDYFTRKKEDYVFSTEIKAKSLPVALEYSTCCTRVLHVKGNISYSHICATRTCKGEKLHQETSKSLHAAHWKTYAGTTTSTPSCINLPLGRLGFTSTTLSAATTCRPVAPVLLRLCRASGRAVSPLDFSSVGRTESTFVTPCATTTRLPTATALHQPYRAPRLRRLVALAILRLCCASGRAVSALDFSSVGPTDSRRAPGHSVSRLHRLYINYVVHREYSSPGCSGSTSTMSCDRVPRLVAGLVVDYFAHAACPRASARCTAHRRLLCPRHASGCLDTSRGSSLTTSPTLRIWVSRHIVRLVSPLVVDYFAYAARPGASAHRAACHAARRLLPVRRDFVLRPHRLYFSHAVRRDYLSRGNTGSPSSMPCTAAMSSSGRIASTIHLD